MTQTASIDKAQPETVALFVSDVHLHESLPATTHAFLDFLSGPARQTKRLYLLGDLFDAWPGDDDIETPYHRRIIDALRAVSDAGVTLCWMGGNRDFLVGRRFAKATGVTLLNEPHSVSLAGTKLVLVHGDAQCTDDVDYMAFRAKARQIEWQRAFLAMPLAQRKLVIESMRDKSREAQRSKTYAIMDVNADAIATLFGKSKATVMVHGHTHRPARHEHEIDGKQYLRYVLPDWQCEVQPPRGGWLALDADGKIRRCRLDGSEDT